MPMPKLLRKISEMSLRKKRSQSLDSSSARNLARSLSPQEPVPPLPPPKSPLRDGAHYIITPPPSQTENSPNNTESYHVVDPPPPVTAATALQAEDNNHGSQHAKGTDPQILHSNVDPQDELNLSAAWEIANKAPVVSKTDKMLQTLENGMTDAKCLQKNSTAIVAGVTTFLETTGGMKAIEEGINHFLEGSTVLMNALDEVAKLHPFVGVAVMAFKAVWTLEMKRRENDKKIIALYVEMKDMMQVLVQLRRVKDAEEIAPDGSTIKARMQDLIRSTAEDIKCCANACDTYSKKKLIVKILKGPIWEGRLVAFVGTFTKRRSEFEFALSIHTSLGVDAANKTLGSVDQTTRALEAKIDLMTRMFQTFMLPDQKEITRLVEQKGGAKACQENDKILKELNDREQKATQSRSSTSSSTIPQGGSKLGGITALHDLKEDLRIDPDTAMRKNMDTFSNKFNAQMNQLKEELSLIVEREGDRVISAMTSGPHDRIVDPDVHQIWEEMRWRGSVKTRTFVMTLRDYFQEKWTANAVPVPNSASHNDEWALAHLNLVRLQPINEAVDDDCSGFITVAEVNKFTTSRPLGWSLPHWIAYWAIGWHQSMMIYKDKISDLFAKMFAILPNVKLSNQEGVNWYLNSVYEDITTIAESLNPCLVNDALQAKFNSYVEYEETRMARNLKAVRYDIDAMDTLALVTGPGRIEKFIFPLLYLLLKHHFELFRICQHHETHVDEVSDAADTILWMINAFDERFDILQSLFKQQKFKLARQFETFAHGIFKVTNDMSLLWDSTKMIEESQKLPDYQYDDNVEDQEVKKEDILNYPHDQEQLDFAAYDHPTLEPDTAHISRPLSDVLGPWNGLVYAGETATAPSAGMISMTLLPVEDADLRFRASSRSDMSDISVSGECSFGETTAVVVMKFTMTFPARYPTKYFHGRWEAVTDTLTGTWGLEDDDTVHDSVFVFKRVAPELLCFLPSPSAFKSNNSSALWTFAISSTLAEIRRKRWSWTFFRQRRNNRKRFIELLIRTEYGRPLDDNEQEELAKVRQTFTTADSRFHHSLAEYRIHNTLGHLGYSCDHCEGLIGGGRIICLECQSNDSPFRTIDFCETSDCMSAQVVREDLNRPHLPTHDLAKARRVVHTSQFGKFYKEAQEALEHARTLFRSRKADAREEEGETDDSDRSSGRSEVEELRDMEFGRTCAVCKLPLSQPCWYCVQCDGSEDNFICYACETRGGMEFGCHKDMHDLVKCQEIETAVEAPGESSATLEGRFAKHEVTMDERLSQLGLKVDNRLSRVESLLEIVLKRLPVDLPLPELA